jgi:hypothetical protein
LHYPKYERPWLEQRAHGSAWKTLYTVTAPFSRYRSVV